MLALPDLELMSIFMYFYGCARSERAKRGLREGGGVYSGGNGRGVYSGVKGEWPLTQRPYNLRGKGGDFRRLGERALAGAGVIGMSSPISIYCNGNGGTKFWKKMLLRWESPTESLSSLGCPGPRVFKNGAECRWAQTCCKVKTSVSA
jgi:hypothetical protein